ncbi:hypothetical protein LTR67_002440 [Exophiala xenobiotica]
MAHNQPLRYADIGINLGDPVFRGEYHGKKAHDDDLEDVIQRALDVGCTKFMVTGSNLEESRHAVEIAKRYRGPDALIKDLRALALEAKQGGCAVAFGEIGLDYDRLFLSPKDVQLKYFELQLDLAEELHMPLFLHSRACSEDFERIISARLDKLPKKGLVHSFTGTVPELESLVKLGFDVGINGCSMKTEENLEAVKAIPLEGLQIETDGPWCEIRPSHASSQYLKDGPAVPKAVKKEKWQKGLMVKGRNEPATIVQVAHVIAKVKGISVEEVCEAAWRNSTEMFGLGTDSDSS